MYLPVVFQFQLNTKTDQQTGHMEALLYVVIRKFRYDETYNFDSQGEDEIMFLDYRRELKVFIWQFDTTQSDDGAQGGT